MRLIILLLSLLGLSSAQAFTFAPSTNTQNAFLTVDQAFQLSTSAPENGRLKASWIISDGYYLYQKQFRLGGKDGQHLYFAPFPDGEQNHDAYYGDVTVYRDELELAIYYDINLPVGTRIQATLSYQGCADLGLCYPPETTPISFVVPPLDTAQQGTLSQPQVTPGAIEIAPSAASNIRELLDSADLWLTLVTIFGLGLLLSFTPCVLPMVPIVSAIVVGTKSSKLNAFLYTMMYVLGMALTYAAIGFLVAAFGASLNLQAQLQNPILLGVSAFVFVLLALVMLGAFELKLPSFLSKQINFNPAGGQSVAKASLGSFLAGIFSTLVVSPCVSAPLAGILLYISTQNEAWYGAAMLFVMAIGMSTPLILVGLFGPRVLPKNGEWLNEVKSLMGFGLLAVAIWMVTSWLPALITNLLWAALALLVSSYFFHRIATVASHIIRWFVALTTLLLCAGLIYNAFFSTSSTRQFAPIPSHSTLKTTDKGLFSHHIGSLAELDKILAQSDSRPIVLDLYADWCISCKIMEDEIFMDPEVYPLLEQVRLVKVDVTENSANNKAFMAHFNLFGPPSLLFYQHADRPNDELSLIGEPNKEQVLTRLQYILQ
ncbi:protein-disulfide reductase DsbD [Marinomonas sp.]